MTVSPAARLGLQAELVHYCEQKDTPENALLLAYPERTSRA